MAVGNMVYYLPHRPSAIAIRRIQLLLVKPVQRSIQSPRQIKQIGDCGEPTLMSHDLRTLKSSDRILGSVLNDSTIAVISLPFRELKSPTLRQDSTVVLALFERVGPGRRSCGKTGRNLFAGDPCTVSKA